LGCGSSNAPLRCLGNREPVRTSGVGIWDRRYHRTNMQDEFYCVAFPQAHLREREQLQADVGAWTPE
jgi:hypothetical protein